MTSGNASAATSGILVAAAEGVGSASRVTRWTCILLRCAIMAEAMQLEPIRRGTLLVDVFAALELVVVSMLPCMGNVSVWL